MVQDQAGKEIVVSCRVTEADFGFGDGEVESVKVPLSRGSGFNIGVKWDDASKGGPSWSATGGGRGAQHLLVIADAPAASAAGAGRRRL